MPEAHCPAILRTQRIASLQDAKRRIKDVGSAGSSTGKTDSTVAEISPLSSMSANTPAASPPWYFSVFLYPCSDATEALEMLLSPGVNVEMST